MRRIRKWLPIVLCALVMACALPVWIEWTGALDVAEAQRLFHRSFPADWQAVNVNHGVFTKQEFGRPADHPLAFAGLSVLAFGPGVLILVLGFLEGYRKRPDETP